MVPLKRQLKEKPSMMMIEYHFIIKLLRRLEMSKNPATKQGEKAGQKEA